jgi:twitching motility protein PilI
LTRRNANARLLLVGARHGINSALLVDRTLGLRNLDDLELIADPEVKAAWAGESRQDVQGHKWTLLKLKELFADPSFLDIGL